MPLATLQKNIYRILYMIISFTPTNNSNHLHYEMQNTTHLPMR